MADAKAGPFAGLEAGWLTTHVLDTSLGRPAADLGVKLFRIESDGERTLMADVATNGDGRCDAPLLSGSDFRLGRYELVFACGPYLAATAPAAAGEPPFLEDVVIRFGMSEASHYHVPLLLSPFSYSTYRGS